MLAEAEKGTATDKVIASAMAMKEGKYLSIVNCRSVDLHGANL